MGIMYPIYLSTNLVVHIVSRLHNNLRNALIYLQFFND